MSTETRTERLLSEAETIIAGMGVSTSMPEYGRLWLKIEEIIWRGTGGGPDYQRLRDRLHKAYTDRVLELSQ